MICEICWENTATHGLCESCARNKEQDAALGRMLRKLPNGWKIVVIDYAYGRRWIVFTTDCMTGYARDTPDAALSAALGVTNPSELSTSGEEKEQ